MPTRGYEDTLNNIMHKIDYLMSVCLFSQAVWCLLSGLIYNGALLIVMEVIHSSIAFFFPSPKLNYILLLRTNPANKRNQLPRKPTSYQMANCLYWSLHHRGSKLISQKQTYILGSDCFATLLLEPPLMG